MEAEKKRKTTKLLEKLQFPSFFTHVVSMIEWRNLHFIGGKVNVDVYLKIKKINYNQSIWIKM